jgi:hypothetical protein
MVQGHKVFLNHCCDPGMSERTNGVALLLMLVEHQASIMIASDVRGLGTNVKKQSCCCGLWKDCLP